MPSNKDRERGPSQEERRRRAANQPLGGNGPTRNPNNETGRSKRRSDRTVRNVSSVIALIMLIALLSPLFFTCIQQQGVTSSSWLVPSNAEAAALDPLPTIEGAAARLWATILFDVPSTATLANNDTGAGSDNLTTPQTASLAAPLTSLPDGEIFVGETGHFIKAPFLDYWQTNGAADVFGNPISEPFQQDGHLVQLFDQALLEYHPELKGQKGEVQLGFLGKQLADAQNLSATDPAFDPIEPSVNTATERYFPETSHSLSAGFKAFWERNGLLKFLGLPISQELTQNNLTVQYFERGRLEYDSNTQKVDYSNSGDLLVAAKGWPASAKFNFDLNISNDQINQGRTLSVRVWGEGEAQPAQLQGHFGTYSLKFGQSGPVFKAFVPISPSIQPAPYPLVLTFTDPAGRAREISRTIRVNYYDFGTQDLTLSSDQSYLADHSADDYDDSMLASVYDAFSPSPLWSGLWQLPLKVPWTLTTNFGQRRTLDGKLDTLYYHGGLDMAPDSGADGGAIYAPAIGKVVFIGALEARGNTVALDHGLGVTSYYFHLSKSSVKVGQLVQPGDLLGLVGSTGRATGPHLHWEVRVNGIITDPRLFLQQDLSK